ncbi:MAG TPA: hypothetical protein VK489_09500 [Ferruginibacter sp.]|nr:hypothetical protein [Ferruginibacter sp.]
MNQLIASYLFQNRRCPLPGLGTLSMHMAGAEADISSKQISSPKPVIKFEHKEVDVSGFLNYVADRTQSDIYEATEALDHLCDNLKTEVAGHAAGAKLVGIGNFFKGKDGKISFKQEELPAAFLQPVFAERVIHPDAEHHILVGDKETTNTVMAEYFNDSPVVKNRWWVWAIVLGAIGLVSLLIYLNAGGAGTAFGNAVKI